MLHRSPFFFLALGCLLVSPVGEVAAQSDNLSPTNQVSNVRQMKLWSSKVPGQAAEKKREIKSGIDPRIGEKVTEVTQPMISIYSPPKDLNNGAAVVICPGGGYHILAYDLEGTEVARWLNSIGVTGVVLHYRVPRAKGRPKHELPLMDLQRAISVVRFSSKELGIDAKRIGVLGFSAGGHLAAMGSTAYKERSYQAVDDMDNVSIRPDFTVLVYPAYLNQEKEAFQLSSEFNVNDKTPPAILIHTSDDPVSSLGSIAYYSHLKKAKVPAELHVFPDGGHGYGLRPSSKAVSGWPKLVHRWLKTQSIIE